MIAAFFLLGSALSHAEHPFRERVLPPGQTEISATIDADQFPQVISAIQKAVAEWNRAFSGLGVALNFNPSVRSARIIVEWADRDWLKATDTRGNSPILSTVAVSNYEDYGNKEIGPFEFYLYRAKIWLNPSLMAGGEDELYSQILLQLGNLVGLNCPEYTGSSELSVLCSDRTRRSITLTEYDIKLCRALYATHLQQGRLLAEAKLLHQSSLIEKKVDDVRKLMTSVYAGETAH
jgi:hypothetical protein